MKCTECGKHIPPIFVIDIDGTLGNYHDHFTWFAERYLGISLPLMYDGSKEFSEFLGLDKQVYRDIKLAYRQGGLKRFMPVYDDAASFMQTVHTLGYETWIATTRPFLRLDNIDPDTRFWLSRNSIPYDGMIYGDDKYEQLKSNVDPERVIMVVEDLGPLCEQALFNGFKAWQPVRMHNHSDRWVHRFEKFDDLIPLLKMSYREWEEEG